ncbi:MAG: CapA family protein [Gammaproteobacteria bacterium]|nr:MAG: CapA family protein [Gammaproteobacteria bacterium]
MINHSVNNPGRDNAGAGAASILFSGDLVLDVADADYWLSGIAPAIHGADLAIGHLEVPHCHGGDELVGDVPAPGADPENLDAAARAGFRVLTLAGNHIADCGAEGIRQTIDRLDRLGIGHAGAGANLTAARAAAMTHCGDRRVAVLSYNCVGPEAAWATAGQPGCAYLPILTGDGSPVRPLAPLTVPAAAAVGMLHSDIAAVRAKAELVIVALHKGIVHTPARLATYERPLAQAAIDAGADVVISHHAHILRGIEFHRGRPIYHGLGNGCVVTRAFSSNQDHPARAEWSRRRRELFGFEPDPAYELAPFHPEAVHSMLGRLLWHPDGRIESGFVPVFVEPPGQPVLAGAGRAAQVCDYVARITLAAGLPALQFEPRADMVGVSCSAC